MTEAAPAVERRCPECGSGEGDWSGWCKRNYPTREEHDRAMVGVPVGTYLNAADAMHGPFEPKTPCDWMPTRPCVVWNDPPAHADDRRFPVARCAETCWRYDRPVEPAADGAS